MVCEALSLTLASKKEDTMLAIYSVNAISVFLKGGALSGLEMIRTPSTLLSCDKMGLINSKDLSSLLLLLY